MMPMTDAAAAEGRPEGYGREKICRVEEVPTTQCLDPSCQPAAIVRLNIQRRPESYRYRYPRNCKWLDIT